MALSFSAVLRSVTCLLFSGFGVRVNDLGSWNGMSPGHGSGAVGMLSDRWEVHAERIMPIMPIAISQA